MREIHRRTLYVITGVLFFLLFLTLVISTYSLLPQDSFMYNWFDTIWRSVNFVNMFFWLSGYEFLGYLAVGLFFLWLAWKRRSPHNLIYVSAWLLGFHAFISLLLAPLLSTLSEGMYFFLIVVATILQIVGFLCFMIGLGVTFLRMVRKGKPKKK